MRSGYAVRSPPGCCPRNATLSTRPKIVVLVGLPGSGKSTWIAKQKLPCLSSDAIRHLLADDISDQSIHRQVFATLRHLLKRRLELRRPVTYIDATNLAPWERRAYLVMGALYDCEVEAVFFDIALKICKKRNRHRARVVPDEVMDAMAARMVPPNVEEGFHRVEVVSKTR